MADRLDFSEQADVVDEGGTTLDFSSQADAVDDTGSDIPIPRRKPVLTTSVRDAGIEAGTTGAPRLTKTVEQDARDSITPFIKKRAVINGVEYYQHKTNGLIYDNNNKPVDDPAVLKAFGKDNLSDKAQGRTDALRQFERDRRAAIPPVDEAPRDDRMPPEDRYDNAGSVGSAAVDVLINTARNMGLLGFDSPDRVAEVEKGIRDAKTMDDAAFQKFLASISQGGGINPASAINYQRAAIAARRSTEQITNNYLGTARQHGRVPTEKDLKAQRDAAIQRDLDEQHPVPRNPNEIDTGSEALNAALQSAGPQNANLTGQTLKAIDDLSGEESKDSVGDWLITNGKDLGKNIKKAEVPSIGAIRLTEPGGFDRLGKYVGQAVGNALGSSAPPLVGGGIGGYVGGRLMGKYGAVGGSMAGAYAGSAVLNIGSMREALVEEGLVPGVMAFHQGEDLTPEQIAQYKAMDRERVKWRGKLSIMGGAAMSALDSLLPGEIAAKLTGATRREVEKIFARRLIEEMIHGAKQEGWTEGAQQAIQDIGVKLGVGKTVDLPALLADVLENSAQGFLGGGVMGAGGEVVATGQDLIAPPPPAVPPPGSPPPAPGTAPMAPRASAPPPPGATPPGSSPPAPGTAPMAPPRASTSPSPGAAPTRASVEDYLVAAGFSAEQITDMNPDERTAEAKLAFDQGVRPVPGVAQRMLPAPAQPSAPAPGTAPMAPRATPPAEAQQATAPAPGTAPMAPRVTATAKAPDGSTITATEKPDFSQTSEPVPTGDGSRASPISATHADDVAAAGEQVNTAPTEAQIAAGNYRKGHVRVHGLDVTVENPKGSTRSGTAPDGTKWETTLPGHYGYVKRTEGADGDQVDVYIGDHLDSQKVYVIDQKDPKTGRFDEHKAILAARSYNEALTLYHKGFSDKSGPSRMGGITEMTTDQFKDWVKNGDTTKPLKGQKVEAAAAETAKPDFSGQAEEVKPGADLPNGFRAGVEPGTKYRVSPNQKAVGGAVLYEKRSESGIPSEFYIAADGNMIDGNKIALNHPGTLAGLWRPRSEEARAKAVEILNRRGQIKLSSPEDKALRDQLRQVVLDDQAGPAAPTGTAPTPAKESSNEAPAGQETGGNAPQAGETDGKPGRQEQGTGTGKSEISGEKPEGPVETPRPTGKPARQEAAPKASANWTESLDPLEQNKATSPSGRTYSLILEIGRDGEKVTATEHLKDGTLKTIGNPQGYPSKDAAVAAINAQDGKPATKPIPAPSSAPQAAAYGAANKLVSADRAAEVRARLRDKLKNQVSAGIDPELLALGTELAAFHIEAGTRKFADFARAVAADLGTSLSAIRPYLRSWYNGARDMMEDAGLDVAGMDSPDQVKAALAVLDKEGEQDVKETQQRGGVGQGGVGKTGLSAGEQGGTGPDRPLAPESAKDGEGTGAGKRARSDGARSLRQDAGLNPEEPGGRTAADGRQGGSGERLAPDGTGERGRVEPEPDSTRPNYFIADPENLIGGTPKVRFAKNRKAIETYRTLTEEQRDPTAEELDAMAGYIGWGSFGQELFQGNWQRPMPKDGWQNEDGWLRQHLGQDEWESAQRSIINAHYTDPPTVSAMWDMAKRMGFTGGRILEPSMGIGNFFGLMPREVMGHSDLTGIELDRLTGGMAKFLYPSANVQIKGYQESKTPDNFYDLVIGNWPFAADGPADRRYDKLSLSLHDYFFVKALDQVRPGGLVIGITSSGTMDKLNRGARQAMVARADLVAAYRLPSGAFEKYAGTSVVTDIIVLRKRDAKTEPAASSKDWIESVEVQTDNGNQIRVNAYWSKNPSHVLGRMTYGHGTTFGRAGMIVERGANFADLLRDLPGRLPEGIYQPVKRGKEVRFITNNTKDREGAIVHRDGKLYVVQGERMALLDDLTKMFKVKNPAAAASRRAQVEALVKMRRAYGALIDAERDGAADVEDTRAALRKQYQAFTKAHGPVIKSEGIKIFRQVLDPFTASLAALETPDGRPSRILSESTIRQKKKLAAPTVADAFVMARNEATVLNLDRIAEISGKPVDDVRRELLDAHAIYVVPGGGVEVSDVFLSGNVRRKLRELEDAKLRGEDVDRSIEAINKVLPPDVPYFQIEAKLGATWVRNEDYRDFISELLGVSGSDTGSILVRFKAGQWSVRFTDDRFNHRPEATTTWGHDDYPFSKLLRAAMNNQTITIRKKDSDGNYVVDASATAEVNNKAQRIREEFTSWAWRDVERKVALERQYNDIMNAVAIPVYDGSFLDFSGMSLRRGTDAFALRQHQVNAIWRGIANRRGLYAHEVGTGKTYTMGGIAVESRRYGIARKPLLIAHNANSATVAREIQEMYPGAAVLYVSNLNPDEIATTMRRIANDDWDLVVIPHSLIDRMALSNKTLMDLAADDIAALEDEAIAAAEEDGATLTYEDIGNEDAMKKVRSTTAKQLVHQRNRIIKSIEDMSNRSSRENAVAFEDLGIDMVIVDEVHEFKKPPIATRMKMRGLNTSTSNRSIALRFLTDYVKKLNGGSGVHIFTGTPITNTLTEIYNMMRFVMDDQMALDGVKDWDAWFNTFADSSTDVELTATGDYEPVTRLASFVNVAELRRMAGQFMDIVFADDMPEFKPRAAASGKILSDPDLTEDERRQLLNGRTERPVGRPYKKILTDVGPMGMRQQAILNHLVQLSQQFKAASPRTRRDLLMKGDESTPIRVETAAANAGLDPRLADMTAPDEPESKINRAVRNIMTHYREHPKATQVVFMERGFSSSSTKSLGKDDTGKRRTVKVERFNLVLDLAEKLVEQGVKRSEIAIVDGSTSKEKRKKLADKMNRAEIRVIIGNSATLGVGVNMQENLRAMHHLDAPWMPGLLEQRNGRGWRQGNKWNTVFEIRYITEKLDGRRWQVLAVKDRFIKAFLTADEKTRIIEGDAVSDDEGENANDLAQTLSEAAGDPRILLIKKYQNDVNRLENRERMHTYGIHDARAKIKSLREEIARDKELGAKYQDDADHLEQQGKPDFKITIDGIEYEKRDEANEALAKYLEALPASRDSVTIGSYRGFRIMAEKRFAVYDASLHLQRTALHWIKPSVASMDSVLRNIAEHARHYADTSEKQSSIRKLEETTKLPFPQQAVLDIKKKMLADIRQDLELNPVPPPAWLRAGAPVNTLIYVDGKPREVEGHKWNDDGFFVVTADGLVPYMDAKTESGDFVYQNHEFQKPVSKTDVLSRLSEAAKKNGFEVAKGSDGTYSVMAPGGFVVTSGPTEAQAIIAFNMEPRYSHLKNQEQEKKQPPVLGNTGPTVQPQPFIGATQSAAIDDIVAGMEPDRPVMFPRLPRVLTALGVKDSPMALSADTIWKAIDKHGLTPSKIKAALNGLADPVMVFDSATTPGSFVFLVDVPNETRPVVVSVRIGERVGHFEVSIITSVHPRQNHGHVLNWVNQGLVRYFNKQKTDAWSQSRGLQLPKEGIKHRSGIKILRPGDVFNVPAAGNTGPADPFAAEFMATLAQTDAVFQNPVSQSSTLETVLSETLPGITPKGNMMLSEEDKSRGAVSKRRFVNQNGNEFYVIEDREGNVWLDISRFEPGQRGSGVYAAIANYAYNAGKVFIGDPAGLSDEALRRRTDAMLSSALKFGTTRHIAPHPRQVEGDEILGIPPLRWTEGDDLGNVQSLIDVSTASLNHVLPEIKRARYDFATGTFRNSKGEPLSYGMLRAWHEHPRVRAAGVGGASLRRGILLNSLAQAERGERPRLLEQALRFSRQLVEQGGLKGVLYNSGPAPKPVASLSGDELMSFRGPEDMPALRRAAQDWYDQNLFGKTARMLDGSIVQFNRRGMKKSTHGAKGDTLLRAVPAIRSIIENGSVVLREPGNRQGVVERVVLSAPVDFMGDIHHLAVSIHKTEDGQFHYDFTMDRDAGSPGVGVPGGPAGNLSRNSEFETAPGVSTGNEAPRVTRGGLASEGPLPSLDVPRLISGDLNLFEMPAGFKPAAAPVAFVASKKQVKALHDKVQALARRMFGRHLAFTVTDKMPSYIPADFIAAYVPSERAVWMSLRAAWDMAFNTGHEGMHHLRQMNVFRGNEWPALVAAARKDGFGNLESDRMAIYRREYQDRYGMSEADFIDQIEEEGVADMFGAYVHGRESSSKFANKLMARIKEFIEAVLNLMRGGGFQTPTTIMRKIYEGGFVSRLDARAAEVAPNSAPVMGADDTSMGNAAQTMTDAFRKWFGSSKVVDENGVPLVVYHGTDRSFDTFMGDEIGSQTDNGLYGQGFYFTPKHGDGTKHWGTAGQYAANPEGGNIMPVYLSLQNPLVVDAGQWGRVDVDTGKHDGVIVKDWDGNIIEAVAFSPTQIKSATGNNGAFDQSNPSILGSTGRRVPPPRNPAPGTFDAPHDERVMRALRDSTDTLLNRIRRAGRAFGVVARRKLQDRELDLKRTQEAIARDTGQPIPEPQDAYLAASLYPGRVAQMDRNLMEYVIRPLVDEIHRRGLSLEDVDQFISARHAIERNLEIGKLYKPGQQFHDAMYNPDIVGGSGFSENEANAILNAAQASGKLADLTAVGDAVVDLNDRTLTAKLREGLIDQDLYDSLKAKYQFYVPLRGEEDVDSDLHPDAPRTGKRYDIRGRDITQAFGRTTKADSPLAYSIMQAREALVRIEKNRVGKAFLKLAENNPNEGVWEVNKVVLKKVIDKNTGLVRRVFDRSSRAAENDYSVKVGGKAYHITIHHQGLLNAMKGMGRENINDLVIGFHKVNRALAALNTSLDPEFIFRNFLRDLQQTGIVLQEEDTKGMTLKVVRSLPAALAGMNRMLKDDLSTPWARVAQEYANAGGKIGFMGQGDIETEKATLRRLMAELEPGAALASWMVVRDHVFGRIERYNDVIENTMRLAVYKALRERGVTRAKAALAARELTVNFNRKGEWGPVINSFYMFFNASTQGVASMLMRLGRSPRLRKVVVGMFLFALLQDMLNRMIAGDDDDKKNRYDKIPDAVKQKNGIVMLPKWAEEELGVPYLKWPLPLGYNIFHVAGTAAGSVLGGAKSPLEATGLWTSAAGDAFNILGGGHWWNTAAPTVLDPAFDILANEDYFGEKILPTNYDPTKPYAEQYRPGVNPYAKEITDTLASWTGGTPERKGAIDISPEWISYAVDFATGGLGRLLSRGSSVWEMLKEGEDVPANKVPFARVFVGQSSKYADRDEYYAIKDAVEVTAKELKNRAAEGNAEAVKAVKTGHLRELKMIRIVKDAESDLKKLRDAADTIRGTASIPEDEKFRRIKVLTDRSDQIRGTVRRIWNELGQKQDSK